MMIREIIEEDYGNVTALAIQVWLNTYATDGIRHKISQFVLSEFTPQKFKHLHNSLNNKIYVAIDQQHLVGFISIDLDSRFEDSDLYGYEITTLYLHDRFQRQGIGKKLLNSVHASYGKMSWLTTWVHNKPAIEFYKKIGFTQIGTAEFNLLGEKHKNLVLAIK